MNEMFDETPLILPNMTALHQAQRLSSLYFPIDIEFIVQYWEFDFGDFISFAIVNFIKTFQK
jgi:hypothetical protein